MRALFQAGNFLYWVSLYFYVPILPVYAQGMGASLSLVGLMLSAYGVLQLLLRRCTRRPLHAPATLRLKCLAVGIQNVGLRQSFG